MRFAYVSANYESYRRHFYATHPVLALEPLAVQEQALADDAFGWNGAWAGPMSRLGYEAREFYFDNPLLERAWRREHGAEAPADPQAIALRRLEDFAPDVVLYDHGDAELLRALRQSPRPPLLIGWEGGGLDRGPCWADWDLILSCAPESVAKLRAAGCRAEQMHHAFNRPILDHVGTVTRENRIAFFGQLVRAGAFHLRREQNLITICEVGLPFDLYSPSYDFLGRIMRHQRAKIALYPFYQLLGHIAPLRHLLARLPFGDMAEPGTPRPELPVNPRLVPSLRPGQYGLGMYASIARASVCLNIHADNTPDYASNMRLFETTGMGTCLLTDRKRNIAELFEPDREVVVYDSLEDCMEKMRWLIEHPDKAREIGAAGQARTLKENTFEQRAAQLHEHIRRLAAQKSAG